MTDNSSVVVQMLEKRRENTHKNFTHLFVRFVQPGIWFLVFIRQANNLPSGMEEVHIHTLSVSVKFGWCALPKQNIHPSLKSKFVYILFSIKLQQVIKCEPTISQTKIHMIHTTLKPSFAAEEVIASRIGSG